MKKHRTNTKPCVLELKKETVVHLSRAQLANAAGGSVDNSTHPSQCQTWCAGAVVEW